jgi:Putative Ig domain
MSWRVPGSAEPKHATRTTFLQCAALTTTLFGLLLSNACSGFSAPSTNSTAGLTISSVLPSATLGSIYSTTLNVSGGTAPYGFSLASGELPTGLLLGSTTGTILGTPTASGSFSFAILVSDSKEISKKQSLQITVASASEANPGKAFSNLQQSLGWGTYGLTPPSYATCSPSPCDGITYSMPQGIGTPSMSGNSTQYNLGGTTVYADALFNNHLIGDFSSQGMPDNNHTLVPAYHNFTYDVYFYGTNLGLSQAVEFDINQFFDNLGFTWGHECRIAGGNEWDIWDNINQHWVPTGIVCYPNSNSWNHLTIQVQRTPDNQLLYQSITLNGVTSPVNQYYNPGSTEGWYGVTINYQMDGNYEQSPYTVYLDNLTFTYE